MFYAACFIFNTLLNIFRYMVSEKMHLTCLTFQIQNNFIGNEYFRYVLDPGGYIRYPQSFL